MNLVISEEISKACDSRVYEYHLKQRRIIPEETNQLKAVSKRHAINCILYFF